MPTGRVMAARLAAVILIVFHSTVPAETGPEIIKGLEQRIQNGDLAAMHEIAALPAKQALPSLVMYARKRAFGSDDEAAPAAAAFAELSHIPGHAKYCASLISEEPLSLAVTDRDNTTQEMFDVLSGLRTVETVEVLCGYLRDEHINPGPDLFPESPDFEKNIQDPAMPLRARLAMNAELAAWALNHLHLADAPPTMDKTIPSDLMPIWARWWKDRRERGIPFEVLLNGPVPPPGTAYAPDPRFSALAPASLCREVRFSTPARRAGFPKKRRKPAAPLPCG